ncbi:MAG: hypothetical protein FWG74_04555, partial [Planctomycetes bacterium]|nr:hypothetical protein [Planctomycetota bacterium]
YMAAVENQDPAAHLGIAGFHFAYRKSYLPPRFGYYDPWRAKAIILAEVRTAKPSFEEQLWLMYSKDYPYRQNDSEIVKAVLKRAQDNQASSVLDLAKLVLHAQGVTRDIELVNTLVRKAAHLGSHHAMFILGATSPRNGLIQNTSIPRYLEQAASSEEEAYFSSYYHYAMARGQLLGTKGRINARAVKPHIEALRKKALKHEVHAQYWLGYLIRLYGDDPREAYAWLTLAAEKGYREAEILIGIMLFFGIGVEQDLELGKARLDKAIIDPGGRDLNILQGGILTYDSLFPEKNKRILDYLHELNLQNDPSAPLYIGIFYLQSNLHPGQHPYTWFLSAAKRGCHSAAIFASMEARMKKIEVDIEDLAGTGGLPGSITLLLSREFILTLPAANSNNGIGILLTLGAILGNFRNNPPDLSHYWRHNLLAHPQWFALRYYMTNTATVLRDYYNWHYDSFLRSSYSAHDSFSLLFNHL